MSNIKKLIKKYFCLMHAICNVLVVCLQIFVIDPSIQFFAQLKITRGIRNWGLLSWLIIANSCVAHDDKKIIDHLLESSTKHVFNVDQESFLLKMIYDNNQLVYRAVYPFNNIETPGTYRISTMVNNNLAINTSNVTLDLNGNTISGQVTIAANLENITIKNGVIDTTTDNGLLINSGCSNITLSDLTVRNATRGINANGLIDSIIIGCDLSRNTTGLQLDTCHNITVQECNAISNLNAGFCLLSSTTCTFIECQALSTGENNNATANQTIVGFVSAHGNGNTFKQCTANSTQGLSVTDSNSLIAGFALRGSESCSSMCECTAANATSSASGVTIPYGILLEASIASELSLTGVPPIPVTGSGALNSLAWSPDGTLVAVGGEHTQRFQLYEYDRQTNVVSQIATTTLTDNVNELSWAAGGQFIAVASDINPEIKIVRYDSVLQTIALVATSNTPLQEVQTIDFDANGQFVAIGMIAGSDAELQVYQFNQVGMSISQFATSEIGLTINIVRWRPDGLYVAFGVGTSPELRVFAFNRGAATVTSAATISPGAAVLSLDWTPDGKYIVVGLDASPFIRVYEFTDPSTLTLRASATGGDIPDVSVQSVTWSSDGQYFVATTITGDTYGVRVYRFDRSAPSITQVAVSQTIPTGNIKGSWSPDGGLIMVAAGTDANKLLTYQALDFPLNNVINNNQVYCNSGGSIPSGIGISGSSIANLMIGNSSFDNAINPGVVYTNYAFVTNVFNQNFGTPNVLQNLSFGSTEPIQTPDDTILILERSISKACDIQTKVNILLSIYG